MEWVLSILVLRETSSKGLAVEAFKILLRRDIKKSTNGNLNPL